MLSLFHLHCELYLGGDGDDDIRSRCNALLGHLGTNGPQPTQCFFEQLGGCGWAGCISTCMRACMPACVFVCIAAFLRPCLLASERFRFLSQLCPTTTTGHQTILEPQWVVVAKLAPVYEPKVSSPATPDSEHALGVSVVRPTFKRDFH